MSNRRTKRATAQKTADSFVNLGARVGLGAGSQQDGASFSVNYLSRNRLTLEAAYRSNWVAGRVVDTVAEDMTRAGIDILSEEIEPDDQKAMHQAFEDMGLWRGIADTVKWSRLYGGCVLVLLVDGQRLDTPLDLDTVGPDQFKGVIALDRWQIMPTLSDLVTEYGPDLGAPMFYQTGAGARALLNQRIHYTRVIRMDGLDLPWFQQLAENGWGQSVLERLWDRLIAFDSTTEGAAQLVFKAHLRTLKIPQFRELIAAGGPAFSGVQKMLDMIRQMQSNEGLTVIDGADEFETHSYTFAGLDNVLLQFGQQLSGATQIPLVRLFGQSPAGLNSTGESDLRTYYDGILQQQDTKLRRGVGVLLELVSRSVLGKPLPEGTEFEFVSLWQLTPEQKADVAKTVTDAVVAAEGAGIISPAIAAKELRQSARGTGVYSHIDDDFIDQLDTEPPSPDDMLPDPNAAGLPGAPGQPGAPAPKLKAVGE